MNETCTTSKREGTTRVRGITMDEATEEALQRAMAILRDRYGFDSDLPAAKLIRWAITAMPETLTTIADEAGESDAKRVRFETLPGRLRRIVKRKTQASRMAKAASLVGFLPGETVIERLRREDREARERRELRRGWLQQGQDHERVAA